MNERNAKHLNNYRQYSDVIRFRTIKKIFYSMTSAEFKKIEPSLIFRIGELRDQRKLSYKWKMFWKRIFDWINKVTMPKVKMPKISGSIL